MTIVQNENEFFLFCWSQLKKIYCLAEFSYFFIFQNIFYLLEIYIWPFCYEIWGEKYTLPLCIYKHVHPTIYWVRGKREELYCGHRHVAELHKSASKFQNGIRAKDPLINFFVFLSIFLKYFPYSIKCPSRYLRQRSTAPSPSKSATSSHLSLHQGWSPATSRK